MTPFTVHQLKQHPLVISALDSAWTDSNPGDPALRHEEGGWVYQHGETGELFITRAPPGHRASIDLTEPPATDGAYVIARFHTHPNPNAEGWYTGPSTSDTDGAWEAGVPCVIIADDGIHTTGPEVRIGGLTGNPGYPLATGDGEQA